MWHTCTIMTFPPLYETKKWACIREKGALWLYIAGGFVISTKNEKTVYVHINRNPKNNTNNKDKTEEETEMKLDLSECLFVCFSISVFNKIKDFLWCQGYQRYKYLWAERNVCSRLLLMTCLTLCCLIGQRFCCLQLLTMIQFLEQLLPERKRKVNFGTLEIRWPNGKFWFCCNCIRLSNPWVPHRLSPEGIVIFCGHHMQPNRIACLTQV